MSNELTELTKMVINLGVKSLQDENDRLRKEISLWEHRNTAQAEAINRLQNVTIEQRIETWANRPDFEMHEIAHAVCARFAASLTDDEMIQAYEDMAAKLFDWIDNYDGAPYEAPVA